MRASSGPSWLGECGLSRSSDAALARASQKRALTCVENLRLPLSPSQAFNLLSPPHRPLSFSPLLAPDLSPCPCLSSFSLPPSRSPSPQTLFCSLATSLSLFPPSLSLSLSPAPSPSFSAPAPPSRRHSRSPASTRTCTSSPPPAATATAASTVARLFAVRVLSCPTVLSPASVPAHHTRPPFSHRRSRPLFPCS